MSIFKFKIPLHTQILIALIAGAAFGAFFNVGHDTLIINYNKKGELLEETIEKWNKIVFEGRENEKVFYADEQTAILKHFKKIEKKKDIVIEVHKAGEVDTYTEVITMAKEKTIATAIKPLGSIFIRLLSFLAIPLVIATLIVGAASLKDIRKLGRVGGKTFGIYIITTAIAISIGLGAANIIKPGEKVSVQAKERLMGTYQDDSPGDIDEEMGIDILDFLVQIVPKNPINAMADGRMLQIVFFAVFFGITLTLIDKSKSDPVIRLFDGISDVMIKMVDVIMLLAPYGVFALIAATVADFGFDILQTLVWYMGAVILGLALQTFIVYPALLKFVGKSGPIKYFKAMRNAQAIAFSSSSSAATLPVTLDAVENKLGIPKQIAGFVLPLGATINMDGTALYQGVAAVFIAQVYGMDLTMAEQLTIVLTAVLASIGTAPVPGVGIIMLVIILQSVNIPPEGIALILGVDRLLDMCRTVTNVTGDGAVAVTIAGTEKKYNSL